jgi:hypothetical protein
MATSRDSPSKVGLVSSVNERLDGREVGGNVGNDLSLDGELVVLGREDGGERVNSGLETRSRVSIIPSKTRDAVGAHLEPRVLGVDEDSDTVAGSGVENSPHVAVQSSELLKVLRSDTVRDVGEGNGLGRSEERELILGRSLEKEVEG